MQHASAWALLPMLRLVVTKMQILLKNHIMLGLGVNNTTKQSLWSDKMFYSHNKVKYWRGEVNEEDSSITFNWSVSVSVRLHARRSPSFPQFFIHLYISLSWKHMHANARVLWYVPIFLLKDSIQYTSRTDKRGETWKVRRIFSFHKKRETKKN